jgi:hypothetical protein
VGHFSVLGVANKQPRREGEGSAEHSSASPPGEYLYVATVFNQPPRQQSQESPHLTVRKP